MNNILHSLFHDQFCFQFMILQSICYILLKQALIAHAYRMNKFIAKTHLLLISCCQLLFDYTCLTDWFRKSESVWPF